ncbi:hypothetical protein K431DRAFT_314183 [Polychaeton citri CBS 116435]|uniref:Uncharacterized protein n=1 Tax=Polychaeton citri CBS 116435 TaxID=1314669 RepID=A0A9P4Q2H7_9PEZI|nr:hypothetical protein K431DRAFT_314183 [Polychaeton citri CBS 116435]
MSRLEALNSLTAAEAPPSDFEIKIKLLLHPAVFAMNTCRAHHKSARYALKEGLKQADEALHLAIKEGETALAGRCAFYIAIMEYCSVPTPVVESLRKYAGARESIEGWFTFAARHTTSRYREKDEATAWVEFMRQVGGVHRAADATGDAPPYSPLSDSSQRSSRTILNQDIGRLGFGILEEEGEHEEDSGSLEHKDQAESNPSGDSSKLFTFHQEGIIARQMSELVIPGGPICPPPPSPGHQVHNV